MLLWQTVKTGSMVSARPWFKNNNGSNDNFLICMHEFVNSQKNQIILCLLKVKKLLVVQSDLWVIESLVIDVTNLCVCVRV